MRSLNVLFVYITQFLVFSNVETNKLKENKLWNYLSHLSESVQSSQNTVKIKCPTSNFAFDSLTRFPSDLFRGSFEDDPFTSAEVIASPFKNVVEVDDKLYKCSKPVLENSDNVTLKVIRGLDYSAETPKVPTVSKTGSFVTFDCIKTDESHESEGEVDFAHFLSPFSFRRLLRDSFLLPSSKSYCDFYNYEKDKNNPTVRKISFQVQDGRIQIEKNPYKKLRSNQLGESNTKAEAKSTIDPELDYPEIKRRIRRPRRKDSSELLSIPTRPRVVQQTAKMVQIEWKMPLKGVPVEYFRVEYMKDNGRDEWKCCHEGNLGSRVRSFRFDNILLYKKYRFRILAHYENGEDFYSATTTWFRLEEWK